MLKYTNGTGIINGDRSQMKHPGQYYGAGTVFTYGKGRGQGCPGECLYAPGPITTDIDIQVEIYGVMLSVCHNNTTAIELLC